ncbi:MAG: Oligopeptide transport system permease protein OppB [Planctomycetota bacterium]|jgi:oligopeptide transport system permease protein
MVTSVAAMLPVLLRRLIVIPPLLLAIYTITFALVWLAPGNPLENPEGRRPPPEVVEAMQRQYRLDDPVAFYLEYLGKASGVSWVLGDAERPFDLGPSLRQPDLGVNEILRGALPVSVTLGAAAMLLAVVMGVVAGTLSGLHPRRWIDALVQLLAMVGISLPSFVIGAGLLILFAARLKWFPVGGWGGIRPLVLPAVALSLPFAATVARLVRVGMIEQMSSEHVRTARAKGLSRARAARDHALKNAMLPVLSWLGPATAFAFTGSFVVEKVFAVPGLGRWFVDGVLGKDLTLVMGITLTYGLIVALLNLAVDLLYAWVDPRIRAG